MLSRDWDGWDQEILGSSVFTPPHSKTRVKTATKIKQETVLWAVKLMNSVSRTLAAPLSTTTLVPASSSCGMSRRPNYWLRCGRSLGTWQLKNNNYLFCSYSFPSVRKFIQIFSPSLQPISHDLYNLNIFKTVISLKSGHGFKRLRTSW